MTRSTKKCLHCRKKLHRADGRWLHETLEDARACEEYRRSHGIPLFGKGP